MDVDELAVRVGELGGDGVGKDKLSRATIAALGQETAMHGLGHAKQHIGLVDEVGAEVVEDGAALGNAHGALPVGRGGGLVAVKVGVELENAAEGVVGEQVADEEEVGVPAAVLVDADEAVAGAGNGDELVGLGGGGDKGLLGEDVLAGFEGGLCEGKVLVGRGGDDDYVDVGVGDEVVGGGVVLGRGVVGGGRVAVLGVALDNGMELELGEDSDEGDVEDFGGEAVTG